MIYQFKKFIPVIDESSFMHPLSSVTGNVVIGKNVYVCPGAAVRGDFGKIIIEDGCNVQENCTIHIFPGVTVPKPFPPAITSSFKTRIAPKCILAGSYQFAKLKE